MKLTGPTPDEVAVTLFENRVIRDDAEEADVAGGVEAAELPSLKVVKTVPPMTVLDDDSPPDEVVRVVFPTAVVTVCTESSIGRTAGGDPAGV